MAEGILEQLNECLRLRDSDVYGTANLQQKADTLLPSYLHIVAYGSVVHFHIAAIDV